MFDLDKQLRHWRQETEATLAFEPEEIDELEDHLKFAVEKAVTEGASPEQAWSTAIARVGASPSLALEFAKSKLMPALFHLVTSWCKPVVLLLLIILLECFIYNLNGATTGGRQHQTDVTFWIITWTCFVTLFMLIPGRSSKLAYLVGIGNAFGLIPLLHFLVYSPLGDRIVGPGWSGMGASFGPLPITLGVLGLAGINTWAWQRSLAYRPELPRILALAAAIVLVLALSPFVNELIGNLSIRAIYSLPTARDITFTGQARTNFMTWIHVDVLMTCVLIICTWLPLILTLIVSTGTLALQGISRMLVIEKPPAETTFPAPSDLAWIMMLAGSGAFWALACFVEPAFSQQIDAVNASGCHGPGVPFSLAFMTLAPALLYLVCSYELTKRLRHATRLRYFYASLLVTGEAFVLVGVTLLPAISPRHVPVAAYPSSEPEWLSAVLGLAAAILASSQVLLIGKKVRRCDIATSLWKFDGDNLVRLGALLGLILACTGLILMMVAQVLAFESIALISAMIDWGHSIINPATSHFDPTNYMSPAGMATQAHYPTPHLYFWISSAVSYVSLCLAVALAITIVLSGLEFIRFNTFRLYRARKASRMALSTVALNE